VFTKFEHSAFKDRVRYDIVYLTCSEKLTGSQLSLLCGVKQKI